MEMMQNKGIGSKLMEEERMEYERLRSRNIELETRLRHIEHLLETKEKEVLRVGLPQDIQFFKLFQFDCRLSALL